MNNVIRAAAITDLERIVGIYNQAVRARQTADTDEFTPEEKSEWFREHDPERYPIFVCEMGGIVAGWISVSPYRKDRNALRNTAEISYYVDNTSQRKGIGFRLIDYTLKACPELGIENLFAIILENNTASINLLKKFGFEQWAYLPRVADFGGFKCGHVYLGINLKR